MKAITVELIAERLRKAFMRHGGKPEHPVGLHAWPKNNKVGSWCGVGPVNWGRGEEEAWFDVFVGTRGEHYGDLNRKVAEACRIAGVDYINMA